MPNKIKFDWLLLENCVPQYGCGNSRQYNYSISHSWYQQQFTYTIPHSLMATYTPSHAKGNGAIMQLQHLYVFLLLINVKEAAKGPFERPSIPIYLANTLQQMDLCLYSALPTMLLWMWNENMEEAGHASKYILIQSKQTSRICPVSGIF